MSKETDLLRRAAKLLRSALDRGFTFPHGAAECAAASLLALADQMERAEPVAWRTEDFDTDKSATTYSYEVRDRWIAKGWPVEPLYTHPAPEVTRDAERYRWLRLDHPYSSVYKGEPFIGQQLIGNTGRMVGEHADRAVDKAMAAMQEPKP